MKKVIFMLLAVATSWSLCAQTSQIGKLVTENWLNNYYHSGYELMEGGYDYRNKIYPNTTIVGNVNGVHHEIETDREGKVKSIVLTFSNIKSEKEIRNIVNNYITGYRASVFEKEDDSNRLYIRSKLPSSVMEYRTMDITAAWDYNSFGDFFFNYMRIFFL